jgi:hypothetical protein
MGMSRQEAFKQRNCGNPGDPKHGSKIGSSYQIGNTLRFECNKGFELEGPGSITCLDEAVWSSSIPFCRVIYGEENDDKYCVDGVCKRQFIVGSE